MVSFLSTVPSPNHAPAVRPAKLAALPPRDTMPIRARPVTTPVQILELVAAHEDEFIGVIGFLDDAGSRLDLALVQFARPGPNALQVIRSNHGFTATSSARTLRRDNCLWSGTGCAERLQNIQTNCAGRHCATPLDRLLSFLGGAAGPTAPLRIGWRAGPPARRKYRFICGSDHGGKARDLSHRCPVHTLASAGSGSPLGSGRLPDRVAAVSRQ